MKSEIKAAREVDVVIGHVEEETNPLDEILAQVRPVTSEQDVYDRSTEVRAERSRKVADAELYIWNELPSQISTRRGPYSIPGRSPGLDGAFDIAVDYSAAYSFNPYKGETPQRVCPQCGDPRCRYSDRSDL